MTGLLFVRAAGDDRSRDLSIGTPSRASDGGHERTQVTCCCLGGGIGR